MSPMNAKATTTSPMYFCWEATPWIRDHTPQQTCNRLPHAFYRNPRLANPQNNQNSVGLDSFFINNDFPIYPLVGVEAIDCVDPDQKKQVAA